MSSYWELIHQVESYIKDGTALDRDVPPMERVGGNGSLPMTQDSLEALSHYVHQCTKCDAMDSSRIVFGRGELPIDIMVVGPPPASSGEKEPFSKAGYYHLGQWLRAIGIDIKESSYLTNAIKCPYDGGIPTPRVMQNCLPYLWHQITLAKPRGILITGKIAGQIFLEKTLSIEEMRGEVHTYEHIPVVVTYHPVEVLKNSQLKRPVWEDLQRLQKAMGV